MDVPLTTLVQGLRIPKSIPPLDQVWYPHLWSSGALWTVAVRTKQAELSVAFKSNRIRQDVDTDISTVSDLIDLRGKLPPTAITLQSHKTVLAIVVRIVTTFLMASSLGSTAIADGFATAAAKSLSLGRLDVAGLLNTRLAGGSTVTGAIPSSTKDVTPTIDANALAKAQKEAEHWRLLALSQAANKVPQHRNYKGRGGRNHRN